jgi:hypothetical protein
MSPASAAAAKVSRSIRPPDGRRVLDKTESPARIDKPLNVTSSQEHTSVLSAITPHIFRTLRREPALAITLAYLFVAMAGIFYNYTFYRKFEIPVLTLSQASDFLVAGIQQPMALLLVLSTLPIVWLIDLFNVYTRRRRTVKREALLRTGIDSTIKRLRLFTLRTPPRWFTVAMYAFAIVGYGWTFVQLYADHRADEVELGDAPSVTVWLTGNSEPLVSKSNGWTYLGAVSSYVFVYDHDARRSQILPVNSVARIEPAGIDDSAHRSGVIVAPIP